MDGDINLPRVSGTERAIVAMSPFFFRDGGDLTVEIVQIGRISRCAGDDGNCAVELSLDYSTP